MSAAAVFYIRFAALIVLVLAARRASFRFDAWARRGLGAQDADAGGRGVADAGDKPESCAERWAWIAGCGVLTALSLIWLEISQPFYFTQDDNLVEILPKVLVGCRSAWQGVFPDYNPYVLMGQPLAAEGTSCLTYPPTYLAYAIARHVLGNEYMLIEVFAFLHLLAGYAVTCWAIRLQGTRGWLCAVGALCFILSGSTLIMGRSWLFMLPLAVWAPLLAASLAKLASGGGWKWMIGTGLAVGMYYQAGWAQVWAYAMMLYAAAVLLMWAAGIIRLPQVLWAASAILLGIGLSVPLLAQQIAVTAGLVRDSGYGNGIADGVPAMLLPYPLARARHPDGWGNVHGEYMGHFFFSGAVFTAVFVLALVCLLTSKPSRQVWGRNANIVCAALAGAIALGADGPVWKVMVNLPLLGRINDHPIRALPFLVLFSILGGAVFIERCLRGARHARIWGLAAALLVCILMLYHVSCARAAFCIYDDRPYPALPGELAELLAADGDSFPQRMCPVVALRPSAPVRSLCLNLPSVYGILSFDGYDPIIEQHPRRKPTLALLCDRPAEAARLYGIRWWLVHRALESGATRGLLPWREIKMKIPPDVVTGLGIGAPGVAAERSAARELHGAAVRRIETADSVLWEVPGVNPMAFPSRDPSAALPVRFHGCGAEVDVSSLAEDCTVVVNVLWYPQMKASADGREVPCASDGAGRAAVDVPAGSTSLAVRFSPAWLIGIAEGLAVVVSAFVLAAAARRGSGRTGGAALSP